MKTMQNLAIPAALVGGLTVGVLWLANVAAPAEAQASQCGPRAEVIAHLAERYGETRQSIGLTGNNRVVEHLANEATGSWTIIATMPSGVACLVASGTEYSRLAEPLPAAGEDL